MNTLDLLAHNWNTHGTRLSYPVDKPALAELARMETLYMHPRHGGLLSHCVSYHQGEPLYHHVTRLGPLLFARLSTRAEFKDLAAAAFPSPRPCADLEPSQAAAPAFSQPQSATP